MAEVKPGEATRRIRELADALCKEHLTKLAQGKIYVPSLTLREQMEMEMDLTARQLATEQYLDEERERIDEAIAALSLPASFTVRR